MTAPVSSDLAWLDDLERAHAAGARGQTWGFDALVALKRLGLDADPAALIVAAVNLAPRLVAAVRALWDEHDGQTCCDRTGGSFDGYEHCPTRTTLAAHLAPATPPAQEEAP